MQITQFWSGAVWLGLKILLKLSISRLQALQRLTEEQRSAEDRQNALRTERIQTQSRSPSLWKKLLKKSFKTFKQCHILTEFPSIFQRRATLQLGGSQLMFWLQQMRMSRCERWLEKRRKAESMVSMRVGKSRRLLSFTVVPKNRLWMIRKQPMLPRKSKRPKSLEADRICMIFLLQLQSLRMSSLQILIVWIALRMKPTPTQDPTQTARSNMFHSTYARMRMRMERWQKQEYQRLLMLCWGRVWWIWKQNCSTLSSTKRRVISAVRRAVTLARVRVGRV